MRWITSVTRFAPIFFAVAIAPHPPADAAPAASVRLVVTNPINLDRPDETLEIPWAVVVDKLKADAAHRVVATDAAGDPIPTQAFDRDGDGTPEQLLIQADFSPGQTRAITLATAHEPAPVESRVFGRAVPERLDDYAWESDRVAYRVYGPALKPRNIVSSGIDVWTKSVRHLVIDKWYAKDDYHTDHGEGLDHYKVGLSLGAGGLAIFANDTLSDGGPYASARPLANGPIRVAFELTHHAWSSPVGRVGHTQVISLDAGQNLSRFEVHFEAPESVTELPVALGLVARRKKGQTQNGTHWLAHWESSAGGQGHTGVGVVSPDRTIKTQSHTQTRTAGTGEKAKPETNTHALAVVTVDPQEPFVYFAGAGWSKSGDFPAAGDWFKHVEDLTQRQQHPLQWRFDAE